MLKVINFAAGPGAGKSTSAAGLFCLMKSLNYEVELVTEYAKECVFEERKNTFNDQLYISAKQNHRLERLRGKVQYAITDSPLFLGVIYARQSQFPSFHSLIKEVYDSYNNFNIFIKRVKPYKQIGRYQNEEQARGVCGQIQDLLAKFDIPYITVEGDKDAPEKVFDAMRYAKFLV